MANCYSVDYIAEDHICTDIACNIEKPQQKYRLETVSYRLLGALTSFTGSKPRPKLLQWFETFGPHEGILTHQ